MAEKRHEGGVSYRIPGKDYFEKRQLGRLREAIEHSQAIRFGGRQP